MKTRPTYKEMHNTARELIVEDLAESPEAWRDGDRFGEVLLSEVRDKAIPEDATFEWAVGVLKANPKLLKRKNHSMPDNIVDAVCETILEQLCEDMEKEFKPTVARLEDPNYDDRVDRDDDAEPLWAPPGPR